MSSPFRVSPHALLPASLLLLCTVRHAAAELNCSSPNSSLIANAQDPSCSQGYMIDVYYYCSPRCNPGYDPVPTVLNCFPDASRTRALLSPATFFCDAQPCDMPQGIEHAAAVPCGLGDTEPFFPSHSSSCIAQCEDGYRPTVTELVCDAGKLFPPRFECVPRDCNISTYNVSISCHEPGDYFYHNETCTPKCEDGFVPDVPQLRCFLGNMTPPSYVCLGLPCEVPRLPNLHADNACFEGDGYVLDHGGNCTVRCADGYDPWCGGEAGPGSDCMLSCFASRLNNTFNCTGKPCIAPDRNLIANSKADACAEGRLIPHGGVCTSQCKDGYRPSAEMLDCNLQVLSPPTYECIGLPCEAPTGIPDAKDSACLQGPLVGHEQECTPSCVFGYLPDVAGNLSCVASVLTPQRFGCIGQPCEVQTDIEYAADPACTQIVEYIDCNTTGDDLVYVLDGKPVRCPAGCHNMSNDTVIGVDIYSRNSSVCKAAVHSGAIPVGGGVVSLLFLPGPIAYGGSIQNEVITESRTVADIEASPGMSSFRFDTQFTFVGNGSCAVGHYAAGNERSDITAAVALAMCASQCTGDHSCAFFSFQHGAGHSCLLYSGGPCIDRADDSLGYETYMKVCFEVGVDYWGADIGGAARPVDADSAAACRQLCQDHASCEVFTYHTWTGKCFLKTHLGIRTEVDNRYFSGPQYCGTLPPKAVSHGGRCSPQCLPGYRPMVPVMGCVGTILRPSTFRCASESMLQAALPPSKEGTVQEGITRHVALAALEVDGYTFLCYKDENVTVDRGAQVHCRLLTGSTAGTWRGPDLSIAGPDVAGLALVPLGSAEAVLCLSSLPRVGGLGCRRLSADGLTITELGSVDITSEQIWRFALAATEDRQSAFLCYQRGSSTSACRTLVGTPSGQGLTTIGGEAVLGEGRTVATSLAVVGLSPGKGIACLADALRERRPRCHALQVESSGLAAGAGVEASGDAMASLALAAVGPSSAVLCGTLLEQGEHAVCRLLHVSHASDDLDLVLSEVLPLASGLVRGLALAPVGVGKILACFVFSDFAGQQSGHCRPLVWDGQGLPLAAAASVPLVVGEVVVVNAGMTWNLALAPLFDDTAIACFTDSSDREYAKCRPVWSPWRWTTAEARVCRGSEDPMQPQSCVLS